MTPTLSLTPPELQGGGRGADGVGGLLQGLGGLLLPLGLDHLHMEIMKCGNEIMVPWF